MKGFDAAGDEAYGDISAAATFGWVGGENAAGHVREGETREATDAAGTIEQREELIARLYSRQDGSNPRGSLNLLPPGRMR
jgi:succinate dehydrogenase/fumarate reductase flavoprotein subunit